EVFDRRIQNRQIQIRLHEFQNTVGLKNDVFRALEFAPDRRHGLRQLPLLRAHPPDPLCSRRQKSGAVRLARTIYLLRHTPHMFVRRTVASFAIRRTHAVTKLRDLQRRPLIFRQRGDQSRHDASLANIPSVSAHHDRRHQDFLVSRASVPQNTTPLPRITFLLGIPLCAPRIAPFSIRTWSAMPTCPPITTPSSITALPEIPVCAAMTTSRPTCTL